MDLHYEEKTIEIKICSRGILSSSGCGDTTGRYISECGRLLAVIGGGGGG
jgi:hypothetical protein